MDWLTCVRPSSGKLPKVKVVSKGELDELFERDEGDDDPEVEAHRAEWNRGLAIFRLAPAIYDRRTQVAALTNDVAGVYIHESRSVVIVDHDEPMDSEASVRLLVHELVHAMQDDELALDDYRTKWGETFDAELAVTGLIEGEATLYQWLANVAQRGVAPADVDWEAFYREWRTDELLDADLDDAPVDLARLRFPYAFGGGIVTQHWLSGGREAIDRLFQTPPQTTRDLLFGSTREALVPIVRDVRSHGLPVLADGFESQEYATLGAWLARIYAGKLMLPVAERWDLARVLAADVFTVQHDAATGRNVAAWRLRAMDADDLSAWQTALPPYVRIASRDGAKEVDLIGSIPGLPPSPEALEWRSVEMPEMRSMAAQSGAASSRRSRPIFCAPRDPDRLLHEFRK